MSNCNTAACTNITAGFIDLASYDELEKYLYGCGEALSYFVRTTCKSTWFTQVPVILQLNSGTPDFGQTWSVKVSRQGDYLLQTWLRVCLPNIKVNSDADPALGLRWTRNLMHNLVKEVCFTANDMVVAKFNSIHLDFWAAFTVPAAKQAGYTSMIGDTMALFDLASPGNQLPRAKYNPTTGRDITVGQPQHTVLYLPLPFFYSRDTGVSLPTAALPYNEMTIDFEFRNWNELLIGETMTNPGNTEFRRVPTINNLVSQQEPHLSGVEVWANYAIVSNDERKRMACAPRDILIEQAQWIIPSVYTPAVNPDPRLDIRLSHAIKVLFFAVRNTTFISERSRYVVGSPEMGSIINGVPTKFVGQYDTDPLENATLVYENVNRLTAMDGEYYSNLNPYYHAPTIPTACGYHSYSYALDFICLDPTGSTNYGKLSHISIIPQATSLAIAANNPGAGSATTLPLITVGVDEGINSANGSGVNIRQTYEFALTAVNSNIVRISGGAIGFPIL